jgi:ribosomal protein S18 acetylase RimI-like enzyme
MGQKIELSEEEAFKRRVSARLGSALRDNAMVILAIDGSSPDEAVVGTVDCIPRAAGKGRRALAPDLPERYLIRNVWVEPSFRRQGIGRRLMAEAEALARSRGVTMLELEVMPGNGPARQLYAGLGFRPAEEVPAWMPEFMQGALQVVKEVGG